MQKLSFLLFISVFSFFGCDSTLLDAHKQDYYIYSGFSSSSRLDPELVQRIQLACSDIHGDEVDISLPCIEKIDVKSSTVHPGPCQKYYTGQQVIIFKRIGSYCREALYDVWVCFIPNCDEAGLTYVRTIKSYIGPCPI